MADKSQQGKGFIQPNSLVHAPKATVGVVLNATGTIRIVDAVAASTATAAGGANNSGGSLGFGASNSGAAGPTVVRTRGRGANATAAALPSSGTSSAPSSTVVVVEKSAPKTRRDLVDVPYCTRVWRNVVMQYGEGNVVDPTPLVILGCAVPNVAGVKGIETYYAPPEEIERAKAKAKAMGLTGAAAASALRPGPYTASVDSLFASAVASYNASRKAYYYSSSASSSATTALSSGSKRLAAEAEMEATDRAEEAILKKNEDSEAKSLKYMSYRGGVDEESGEGSDMSHDDSDGETPAGFSGLAHEGSRSDQRKIIRLPMLRPPVAFIPLTSAASAGQIGTEKSQAAGPTMAMVMNHTTSGHLKFTYTDYDGVTSGAIIPIIGGTTTSDAHAANGPSSSSSAIGLGGIAGLDDDDVEAVNLDTKGAGGDKVSAYLNPKAKSNQKYIVKKADLSEKERTIFENLWTLWRKGGPMNVSAVGGGGGSKGEGGAAKRGREGQSVDKSNDNLKDNTEEEREGNGVKRGGLRSEEKAPLSNNSNAAEVVEDVDAEIKRLRRAAEEALAGLDRDW